MGARMLRSVADVRAMYADSNRPMQRRLLPARRHPGGRPAGAARSGRAVRRRCGRPSRPAPGDGIREKHSPASRGAAACESTEIVAHAAWVANIIDPSQAAAPSKAVVHVSELPEPASFENSSRGVTVIFWESPHQAPTQGLSLRVAALSPSSASSRGREIVVVGIAGTFRSSTSVALLLCFDSLAALALTQPDRPRAHLPFGGQGAQPVPLMHRPGYRWSSP